MSCNVRKPLSRTSVISALTSSMRMRFATAASVESAMMNRDLVHGVPLDEGDPIRRKVCHDKLPQVIPDILLCFESDNVLGRFDEGFEQLRFAISIIGHIPPFFHRLKRLKVQALQKSDSKRKLGEIDDTARSRSAARSAVPADDSSRCSHPASAVFPQSSTLSGGMSGRRPMSWAFLIFRCWPNTPHTQTRFKSAAPILAIASSVLMPTPIAALAR